LVTPQKWLSLVGASAMCVTNDRHVATPNNAWQA
jgi:hypothetical protein